MLVFIYQICSNHAQNCPGTITILLLIISIILIIWVIGNIHILSIISIISIFHENQKVSFVDHTFKKSCLYLISVQKIGPKFRSSLCIYCPISSDSESQLFCFFLNFQFFLKFLGTLILMELNYEYISVVAGSN